MEMLKQCVSQNNKRLPLYQRCLETGPKLQNLLRDILVRNRFKTICLCADIQKVFLQIRIRDLEWDALRFFWLRNIQKERIQILRFTRLVFGFNLSPFVLVATLQEHLSKNENICSDIINEIMIKINVDNLIMEGFSQNNFYTDIPSRIIQPTQIPLLLWTRFWRRKY